MFHYIFDMIRLITTIFIIFRKIRSLLLNFKFYLFLLKILFRLIKKCN